MSDKKKFEVTVFGEQKVTSYLYADDLRQAVEKAFKLIPRDWPGRPLAFTGVEITEATVRTDA